MKHPFGWQFFIKYNISAIWCFGINAILLTLFVLAAYGHIPALFIWTILLAPIGLLIQRAEFKYYSKHGLLFYWLKKNIF